MREVHQAEADIRRQKFAELPPQGYVFMTPLQRFNHKVRCAILEVLDTDTVGTWNIQAVLGHISADVEGLTAKVEAPPESRLRDGPRAGGAA